MRWRYSLHWLHQTDTRKYCLICRVILKYDLYHFRIHIGDDADIFQEDSLFMTTLGAKLPSRFLLHFESNKVSECFSRLYAQFDVPGG